MTRKNLLKNFKYPRGITLEPSTNTKDYGKFTAYPFERGYGTTIANSLRRALLASIRGFAITAVKFTSYKDNVPHVLTSEFDALPGVVEDTIDIIDNLKKVSLSLPQTEGKTLFLSFSGERTVTAGDLAIEGIEVENKDLLLMTLMQDAHFNMEIQIDFGRGFVLAEDHEVNDNEVGVIRVDALFSPIKRVSYQIKNTRVGRRSDYDKMELEIWTDGTISPVDALGEAAKITKDHFSVFINFSEDEEETSRSMLDDLNMQKLLSTSVDELELSVRAGNCLKAANIATVDDLVRCTPEKLSQTRNFGEKSLTEIQEKLATLNLSLASSDKDVEDNNDDAGATNAS